MKKGKRLLFAGLLALMCVMNLALPAYAYGATDIKIPVTVKISGPIPSPAEKYTIVMEPDDPSFPLPDGAASGKYTLTVTGKAKENTASLDIHYDTVGIYTYKIYQKPGTNKSCTYDKRTYYLTVYILNNEDMTGLESTVVIYPENPDQSGSQPEKVDNIVFTNKYPTPTDSPKTGDESSPLLYALLIAAGAAIIVALFATRKPRYSEED